MTGLKLKITRKEYRRGSGQGPGPVIRDLRLAVGSGEFVCLVGPSGCGKTTLLNMVAGLDKDYEGRIKAESGYDGGTPRLGYVFQNPRLLPWRTVEENVTLALPSEHDRNWIDHLFEVVGLAGFRQSYPQRLSLGMSRRVSLIRAFAIEPAILLMDEPFVSLDPPTARRIRELVIRLWQERPHTVLFVTHDLREAIELADRLVFLSSSPCSVVGDIRIDLPREARSEENIEAWRKNLISDYPGLAALF